MSWRASSGLRAWLIQRLSAIYILGFILFLVYFLATNTPLHYQSWRDWVLNPLNRILFSLFFLTLIIHSWVGARDIILDYVKPLPLRFTLLSIVMLMCFSCGLWAFFVISRVTV